MGWGEADVGKGAREDGGGCVGFRGSGAARTLGLGGCCGRALCIAVNHRTKEDEEDKELNNIWILTSLKTGSGDRYLPGEGMMGCWFRKG